MTTTTTQSLLKVDTWLPLFSGFYNTIWDTDNDEENELDEINHLRREAHLPECSWDDVEWAYDDYHQAVGKGMTRLIGDKLKELDFITAYTYQKVSSPREYNFANDAIHVQFVLNAKNQKNIQRYLQDNRKEFATYIQDHYTSCSGFISSYSNNSEGWRLDLDAVLAHEHQLGAVLQFICQNEGIKEEDCYEDLIGNGVTLYAKNYSELTGGQIT